MSAEEQDAEIRIEYTDEEIAEHTEGGGKKKKKKGSKYFTVQEEEYIPNTSNKLDIKEEEDNNNINENVTSIQNKHHSDNNNNVKIELEEVDLSKQNNDNNKPKESSSPTNGQGISFKDNIETQHWQTDFKQFPVVDPNAIETKKKKVIKFYEKQNEMVDEFVNLFQSKIQKTASRLSLNEEESPKVENIGRDETITEGMRKLEYWCLHLSFWANVFLFSLKISASVLSLSLSVITSTIDSALDLLSGLILYITSLIRRKKNDIYKYPLGKARLEPLGFIIFATCMSTASLQIIKEGVVQIVSGLITGSPYLEERDAFNIDFQSDEMVEWLFGIKIAVYVKTLFFYYGIFVLLTTIIVKASLYLLCRKAMFSDSVQAYAFDHRNDVLSNILLIASLFISQWLWWFDAYGSTVLSIYIIQGWVEESSEHVSNLVGRAADAEFVQKLTFIAMNHSEEIEKIETVAAWYSGSNIVVEMHIVLPHDMALKQAHDIGETLQLKIESLPDIERCYVHLDYDTEHSKYDEHMPHVE
ncbi:hypothetical protein ABK040_002246 [Willaertia magna]